MTQILKLAIRSLWSRPFRTLLTSFAIVLGVSVILAIDITNLSTLESITDLFDEASGKAHLIVVSADAEGQGFPEAISRAVGEIPGVAAAVPSLHVQTLLAEDASSSGISLGFFVASTTGLLLYGIDPALDPAAREYRLVAGRFLAPGSGDYDVVLVQDYAEKKQLRVGGDLKIVTPNGIETLRVVGLISKDGPGRLNNSDFGVIPLTAAQAIFSRSGDLDQVDVVAAPGTTSGDALDRLKQTLQAKLGDAYSVTYPAMQGKRVTQMLDTYQLGLSFFSAIALFVGAFLIYNAFSMNVVERTREIGMLRAIGMTQRQVMRQILLEAGILAALGSAAGVAGGLGLAKGLIRMMEFLLSQEMALIRVPAEGLARSVAVGILTTLIAASIPAWQASRISPLQALGVRGLAREGWWVRRGWPWGAALMLASYLVIYRIPLAPAVRLQVGQVAVFALFVGATLLMPVTVGAWERLTRPVFRRLYGNAGRLGSSNIRRSRARTTLTAAALMVGVAMVLGIRGLTGTFAHDIESWIDAYIGGDLYVYSSVPIHGDLGRRLEAVEGVAAVTPIRYLDAQAFNPLNERERVAVMFVDPETHDRVSTFVFTGQENDPAARMQELASGDTIFVSSVIAEKYHLGRGDILRLETRRGVHEFTIAAVVVDFYNRGMVVEGSWTDMRRYFLTSDANVFFLKLQPGYRAAEVRDRIDTLYGQRRHLTVDSNESLRARALTLADRGYRMFDILASISVIVASFGVVNTLTMNVTERTREIGALRGLGMTRWQVIKMILAEAGIMSLIGGAFGLVFGLFLSRVFLMAVTAMRDYKLTYVLPTEGIILSLAITALISQLAAILPARRAARLSIVEAIQYE